MMHSGKRYDTKTMRKVLSTIEAEFLMQERLSFWILKDANYPIYVPFKTRVFIF